MLPNGNELYEFLPEEIFQLDQPIVPKSETQNYNISAIHQTSAANKTSVETHPHQHTAYHNEIHQHHQQANSPNFIDLGAKYPPVSHANHVGGNLDSMSAEINNNLNYQLDESHPISSMNSSKHHELSNSTAYLSSSTANASVKFYCSADTADKVSMRKRSFDVESPKLNHNNNQILQHNGGGGAYQTNLIYPKRDNNCFSQFYQVNNRYSSEMYGKMMPTEAYRATEKFNNFIH